MRLSSLWNNRPPFLFGGSGRPGRAAPFEVGEQRGVIYKEGIAAPLVADFFLPINRERKPAVLVVHGGGWVRRSGDMEGICRALARSGFAAVNITYRLAPVHRYPAAVEDVRDAAAWLRAHAARFGVDAEALGGWGYSAGAHLLLLAGLDPAAGFSALVCGGTPADLTAWPGSREVRKFLGHELGENPRLWAEASPVNHVRRESPPVFLYHGTRDWIVNLKQFDQMKAALGRQAVPCDVYTARGLGHFSTYFFSRQSFVRGQAFLRRRLIEDWKKA